MPAQISQYIYGNSLVNFAEGGALTNVPVWMDLFADASGGGYAVSGGYGFLRQFADRSEPGSEWGFDGVNSSWNSEAQSLSSSGVTSVVITPANFIQYQAPTDNYFGDVRSPLDATLEVVADTQAVLPNAQIYVYEGWADMGGFANEVPSQPQALAQYHAYNTGEYHEWYVDYVDQINATDPDAQVTLIPVASVLSELMTTVLADVSPQVFYVDSAPHGTETLYFLAAMVTQTAITGQPLPADLVIPDVINPSVAALYPQLADAIMDALGGDGISFEDPTPPVETPAELPNDSVDDLPDETADPIVIEGPPEDVSQPDLDFVPRMAEPNPLVETNPAFDPVPQTAANLTVDSVVPDTAVAMDTLEAGTGEQLLIDVLSAAPWATSLVHVDAPALGMATMQDNQILYTAPAQAGQTDSLHYSMLADDGTVVETALSIGVLAAVEPETQPLVPATLIEDAVAGDDDVDVAAADVAPANVRQGWDDSGNQFTGTLSVTDDGTYEISFYSDSPLKVWISGQDIALTTEDGTIQSKASVDLSEGVYDFGLSYNDGSGGSEVALVVSGPGTVTITGADGDVMEEPAQSDDTAALLAALFQPEDQDLELSGDMMDDLDDA